MPCLRILLAILKPASHNGLSAAQPAKAGSKPSSKPAAGSGASRAPKEQPVSQPPATDQGPSTRPVSLSSSAMLLQLSVIWWSMVTLLLALSLQRAGCNMVLPMDLFACIPCSRLGMVLRLSKMHCLWNHILVRKSLDI